MIHQTLIKLIPSKSHFSSLRVRQVVVVLTFPNNRHWILISAFAFRNLCTLLRKPSHSVKQFINLNMHLIPVCCLSKQNFIGLWSEMWGSRTSMRKCPNFWSHCALPIMWSIFEWIILRLCLFDQVNLSPASWNTNTYMQLSSYLRYLEIHVYCWVTRAPSILSSVHQTLWKSPKNYIPHVLPLPNLLSNK